MKIWNKRLNQDFTLDDASKYKDEGPAYSKKYFMQRDNLVVTNITDYSKAKDEPESEVDRFKVFALMRLERYNWAN